MTARRFVFAAASLSLAVAGGLTWQSVHQEKAWSESIGRVCFSPQEGDVAPSFYRLGLPFVDGFVCMGTIFLEEILTFGAGRLLWSLFASAFVGWLAFSAVESTREGASGVVRWWGLPAALAAAFGVGRVVPALYWPLAWLTGQFTAPSPDPRPSVAAPLGGRAKRPVATVAASSKGKRTATAASTRNDGGGGGGGSGSGDGSAGAEGRLHASSVHAVHVVMWLLLALPALLSSLATSAETTVAAAAAAAAAAPGGTGGELWRALPATLSQLLLLPPPPPLWRHALLCAFIVAPPLAWIAWMLLDRLVMRQLPPFPASSLHPFALRQNGSFAAVLCYRSLALGLSAWHLLSLAQFAASSAAVAAAATAAGSHASSSGDWVAAALDELQRVAMADVSEGARGVSAALVLVEALSLFGSMVLFLWQARGGGGAARALLLAPLVSPGAAFLWLVADRESDVARAHANSFAVGGTKSD